jgi:transcriptional repressor NrdR
MRCPVCDSHDSRVIDSRPLDDGRAIRRRRSCRACAHRFTTYEHVEQSAPAVVKADGRREAFDRDKVMLGLQKACAKRPVSAARLTRIVDDLEARLRAAGPPISSRAIGELVAEQLRHVDDVAYVRFASVYGRFTDTGAFRTEIDRLEGRTEEPASV